MKQHKNEGKSQNRVLNPKSEVAKIYVSRKEGGKGLISVEDTVKLAILGLEREVLTSDEGLPHLGMIESMKEFKERRRNERSNVFKQKKLQGQLFNQIEEVAGEEKKLWLRDGSTKKRNRISNYGSTRAGH